MNDLSILFGGAEKTELFTMGFGRVNLPGSAASYFVGIVTPPFLRKSAKDEGLRVPGSDDVARVGDIDQFGSIYFCKVKHAPNSVIMLQVSWTRGGRKLRDGAMFIRLRPRGPVLNVTARTPQGPENKLPGAQFSMFIGHGDIMDSDELRVLGIDVPNGYMSAYMNAEELAECFEVTEVVPEVSPRPAIARIVPPGGEARLVEVSVAPPRRLRLRR